MQLPHETTKGLPHPSFSRDPVFWSCSQCDYFVNKYLGFTEAVYDGRTGALVSGPVDVAHGRAEALAYSDKLLKPYLIERAWAESGASPGGESGPSPAFTKYQIDLKDAQQAIPAATTNYINTITTGIPAVMYTLLSVSTEPAPYTFSSPLDVESFIRKSQEATVMGTQYLKRFPTADGGAIVALDQQGYSYRSYKPVILN